MYRYEYAKARHGRNFKVNCPSCGGIKRFNLFYDNKEDRLCDSQYGKCDRVYQCGYENRPQGQTVLKQDEIKNRKTSTFCYAFVYCQGFYTKNVGATQMLS